MSRHRAGADPGSAGTPVSASTQDAATPAHRSPSSATMARTHRNHAAYHGRRYGAARANASRPAAHPPGRRSGPEPSRSRHSTRANRTRNAAYTRPPRVVPRPAGPSPRPTASAPRATSRAPLAHPCRDARLARAVTVRHPDSTGTVPATAAAAATAACLPTARARRSRGRRAATDHTHRSSGMAATILTSVVTVSTAVTANGRGPSDLALGAARKAAAARPAATSASLWPPPTVWITITGFSAISRIAAGARAGAPQSLAAAAPKPAAAATASAATTLNAAIVPAGEPDHSRAIPAESNVKAGP